MNDIKHRLQFYIFSFFLVAFSSTALTKPKSITLLYTNDIHANFIPHNAYWIRTNPKPQIGGFNELYFAVDSLRKIKESTLLLDAGDVMTGNPITEYEYKNAKGGALFEMMNLIGYDAWTIGNHDFDISKNNLAKLINIANFPTLCANISDTIEYVIDKIIKPYHIFEKNEIRIAVIGIMTTEFHQLVNKHSAAGIVIREPKMVIQKWIDTLRPYTDLIIALTHQGYKYDSILAMNVNGLDIIVGGHSHTKLKKPKLVNDVIIVQAGKHCEYLGVLELEIESRRIVNYKAELLPLWYNSNRASTSLSVFIDSIKTIIDKDYNEIICTLKTDWKRNWGESNIGNFITDAQRESINADIAFMNSQGIRADASAGPLTRKDLFTILPFHNVLTKFNLSGKQIRDIVSYYISKRPSIQTSGIKCKWKRNRGRLEFIEFQINGLPLDETRKYNCVANDYMMKESERYLGIPTPELIYLEETLFSVVERKLKEKKEIYSNIENRISRIE